MLTDVKVRNAKPDAKAYKLPDNDGLYVHVLPGSAKTWRVRYKRAGKEAVVTLGRYPIVNLAAARSGRDSIKHTLRAGKTRLLNAPVSRKKPPSPPQTHLKPSRAIGSPHKHGRKSMPGR